MDENVSSFHSTYLGTDGTFQKCNPYYYKIRFCGNQYDITKVEFKNIDMLTGNVIISFIKTNSTGYGFTVVVEPNYE